VCWYIPALFAFHAFALGSLPFDAVTMGISVVGMLLMTRPVLGTARS
jgi:nicotinamide riboside transporter PnuC